MTPLKQLTHILYPPRCVICGDFLWHAPFDAGDSLDTLCQTCTSGFRPIETPFCTICGAPFGSKVIENHPCEDCLRTRPHFQAAYAPYRYEGSVLDAILKLKYGQKAYVADTLGPLLAEFVKRHFMPHEPFLTMPVPLHTKRLRERGFNQSLLLARHIAKRLNTELDFLSLVRTKQTVPQTTLTREDRKRNVKNAFVIISPDAVLEKNILLVDDVATTGNTLNECARVLALGGARDVFCVTLAKAVT